MRKCFLIYLLGGMLLLGLMAACGGDDEPSGDCPNIAGNWTIADHCEEALEGDTVSITQNDCNISADWGGPEPFSGTIDQTGDNITISGNTGYAELTCSGGLEGNTITMDCTPDTCHLELTR